jgi:hypothetical protein
MHDIDQGNLWLRRDLTRSIRSSPTLENGELTGQLAMNDPGLKPEDIVSTGHVFLVFIGADGARRRPDDFQWIPQTQRNDFDRWSAKNLPNWPHCGRKPLALFFGRAQAATLIKLPATPTNIMRESQANIA